MNKKIFDLGSKNIYNDWDFIWDWHFDRDRTLGCTMPYLYCYNNHHPENCERKRTLEEHMWTRRR